MFDFVMLFGLFGQIVELILGLILSLFGGVV